jgi:quercetin dioxygenase-like cupin family protein
VTHVVVDSEADALLYVTEGSGALLLAGDSFPIAAGTAMLVLAGEDAAVETSDCIELLRVTVRPGADRHAPLGPRATIARLNETGSESASGARSYEVLFGPHNGSSRATLFAGYVPPGKAPWHYHLYDEIVWVPEGPGRLHLDDAVRDLGAGSAFRLRPREVHIVENAGTDREMTVIAVFTPAGSPAAAYLTPDVAAKYRFAG